MMMMTSLAPPLMRERRDRPDLRATFVIGVYSCQFMRGGLVWYCGHYCCTERGVLRCVRDVVCRTAVNAGNAGAPAGDPACYGPTIHTEIQQRYCAAAAALTTPPQYGAPVHSWFL